MMIPEVQPVIMGPPDVSVIIVNRNSAHYLYTCLGSVYREAEAARLSVEVTVVDDGSFDGADEIVRELFPEARFLQSPASAGLAKAYNLACSTAAGRTLLFLAPDTELTEGSLGTMHGRLNLRQNIGIVGARLLKSDFTIQPRSIQRFPTIWRQAFESETLRQRYPAWGIWGTKPVFEEGPVSAPVDVVSGACLLVRKELFERVGGFCEDYVLHCHDVDLCHRAHRAGYEVHSAGGSWVIHHGEITSPVLRANHFSDVMMREALFRFFVQTRGPAYALSFQVVMAAAAVCRLALLGVMLPPSRLVRGADALQELFTKWVHVLRWSVGLERWVKAPRVLEALD